MYDIFSESDDVGSAWTDNTENEIVVILVMNALLILEIIAEDSKYNDEILVITIVIINTCNVTSDNFGSEYNDDVVIIVVNV